MIAPLPSVKLLTVAEVAAAARVSPMTIYRMVHRGDLPTVRVGRGFRIAERDALALLNPPPASTT